VHPVGSYCMDRANSKYCKSVKNIWENVYCDVHN